MAASPKQKFLLPAILLANDFLDGEVVFRTGSGGWSRDPAQAFVARDLTEAERLKAEGAAAFKANEVVDAELVDVTVRADGLPVPNHFRERFKIAGPSIRLDLGKQAEFAHIKGA
jgi:sulfite reductase (NADPH) hemoprotein beta-component